MAKGNAEHSNETAPRHSIVTKVAGTIGSLAIAAVLAALGFNEFGDVQEQSAPTTNAASPTAGSSTQSASAGAMPSTSRKADPNNAKDGVCPKAELPSEVDPVIAGIRAGQPMVNPEDGAHFGNYQNVLPKERNNYYREYTVQKPGMNHRGPWRIVTGGGSDKDPETWYFTFDHYESFCTITDAAG